jgi:hypothetical protein
MVTPAAKREAVAHLRSAFDMSERRACRIIGCVRMTVRYRSRRSNDAELRARLRALAHERRRFGYRRLHVFLTQEGFRVNHKRLFRLYREERLMVRRRGGRKRALGTRAPMSFPQLPNDRWSLDFVADQFIDGRRMRRAPSRSRDKLDLAARAGPVARVTIRSLGQPLRIRPRFLSRGHCVPPPSGDRFEGCDLRPNPAHRAAAREQRAIGAPTEDVAAPRNSSRRTLSGPTCRPMVEAAACGLEVPRPCPRAPTGDRISN